MSETEPSIRLRAPEPEDLEMMMAFENDPELWESGTATGPYSRYQLKRYIAQSQNDVYADGQLRLVIEHETAGAVGMIDLCAFDSRHNRAEVGIVVRKDFRRRGIARAALCLLEKHCFRLLGIRQLYAYVAKDNEACACLFLSGGYRQTACLVKWFRTGEGYKDVCVYQKLNPLVE